MIGRANGAVALALAAGLLLAGCSRGPARFAEPPNLLLIVVDTLRADHLSFHGYERNTTPQLTELLAAGGIVFENAYAPASWTAPSMASILTGLDPSRLVPRQDLRAFGIPRGEATLAKSLRARGYSTAGFVGNLFVHQGMGFAQGFDDYWVVPGDYESIPKPAETVLEPALAWLEARRGREDPFFLYVHFMDPHDPYTSPLLLEGKSEFYPEYSGPIRGDHVHPLNEGSMSLSADPASDVRQLVALYDSEILHLDQAAARLISAAERVSSRPTMVVFTSDHGEEIQDHGGWTHGRTLYEEIVHVPLAVRVDGLLRGGRRIAGNVSTIDIAPTLLSAAEGPVNGLDGQDLLPTILDPRRAPARRPIFVRHWQRGPIRAALLVDRRKILLFNHRQPFVPDPGVEANVHAEDSKRLPRFASFDLTDDPREQRSRMPSPDEIEATYALLDPTLDGVRVLLRGLDSGSSIAGTLRFSSAPRGTMPLFLGDADQVSIEATSVRFNLEGEPSPKGFLVLGEPASLENIDIDSTARVAIEVGDGIKWSGNPIGAHDLQRKSWPAWSSHPSLRIWNRESRAAAAERPLDAETRAKLRALGYL